LEIVIVDEYIWRFGLRSRQIPFDDGDADWRLSRMSRDGSGGRGGGAGDTRPPPAAL
jgi:hypothetical protein